MSDFPIKALSEREAMIELIRDMLQDPRGADFVEAAVTHYAALTLKRYRTASFYGFRLLHDHLAFAELILDDSSE